MHPQHKGKLTDLKRLDHDAAKWMAERVEHDTADVPPAAEAAVDVAGQPLDAPVGQQPSSSSGLHNEPEHVPSEASEPEEDVFGWGFGFDEQ